MVVAETETASQGSRFCFARSFRAVSAFAQGFSFLGNPVCLTPVFLTQGLVRSAVVARLLPAQVRHTCGAISRSRCLIPSRGRALLAFAPAGFESAPTRGGAGPITVPQNSPGADALCGLLGCTVSSLTSSVKCTYLEMLGYFWSGRKKATFAVAFGGSEILSNRSA